MDVDEKSELRRYMGPKYAQIPRGAIVRLYAKYGRMGFFEWMGKRFCCPIRLLWRLEKPKRWHKPVVNDLVKDAVCEWCGRKGTLEFLYVTSPPGHFCCKCSICKKAQFVPVRELDFSKVDLKELKKELRIHAVKFLQLLAIIGGNDEAVQD